MLSPISASSSDSRLFRSWHHEDGVLSERQPWIARAADDVGAHPAPNLNEPGMVLSATTRDTVETSVRAGDRLQRVIDALLNISRAPYGALVPDREDLDLASVTTD